MLKRYHHIVAIVFRTLDVLLIASAWLASYWLRFYYPIIEVSKGLPPFRQYATLTPLIVALWLAVFAALKVYQSQRMLRRTAEIQLLLRAHATALLLFVALTYFISEYRYSRAVILYFGVLGAIALIVMRLIVRNTLRALRRRGRNQRAVLIVGSGPSAVTLMQRLERFPELGLRVCGIVAQGAPVNSPVAYLGQPSQLHDILRSHPVDSVILCLSREESAHQDTVLQQLKMETVDIQLVPDLHEYLALGCEVEDFDGMPIVRLNDSPMDGWGALFKRLTDFVLALIALLLLSPVFLLTALAIKLTSRGPVFYGQERMGLDGRTFRMYKFRSMKVDAESASGAVWAKAQDDRRTAIGTLLRKTSLDELPQFWNVLLGQMSLVGPRPERPVFVHQFKREIPHYMLRHKVKAGITGWAQINGWRGDTALDQRIACDLYYIRNWSYALDLKILALTVVKGFVHKNAY